MTPRPLPHLLAATIALALAAPDALAASFIYEGRPDDLGQPANGRYDLRLGAYGDGAQGATLAAPITFHGIEVREGRFWLDVELPLVKADQVWLKVAVRASGEPAFSAIPGRSKAIAAPLIGAYRRRFRRESCDQLHRHHRRAVLCGAHCQCPQPAHRAEHDPVRRCAERNFGGPVFCAFAYTS